MPKIKISKKQQSIKTPNQWVRFDASQHKPIIQIDPKTKEEIVTFDLPEPPLQLLKSNYEPYKKERKFNYKKDNDGVPVKTANIFNNNGDLMKDVAKIYLNEDDIIADITYGFGVFWKELDTTKYRLIPSDIRWNGIDYSNLPYPDSSIDVVVYDPPYLGSGGTGKHKSKKVKQDKHSLDNKFATDIDPKHSGYIWAINRTFLKAIPEVMRVLRKNGLLLFKCQDWNVPVHAYFINIMEQIGFAIEDVFIFVASSTPLMRHTYQKHARKNHSYLIVARKKTY